MKVAVYLRVSTDSQTTDNQRPDIESYLKSHGVPDADVTYYSENETAWHRGHQHELARLKQDVRSGRRKYDLLIIWAFDRLCRLGSIPIILEWQFFMRHGVRVVSIKEPISDLPAEFIPVLLSIFGMIAKWESNQKSVRVKAGIARKAAQGTWKPGRQKGAKDKEKRDRTGYLMRYLKDRKGDGDRTAN